MFIGFQGYGICCFIEFIVFDNAKNGTLPINEVVDFVQLLLGEDENDDPEKHIVINYDQASSYTKVNDPVKMYLKEIGVVPLLKADEEVVLAKRIEKGLKHPNDPVAVQDGIDAKNAYDDAINAGSYLSISGGRVWAYSRGNDGIDCNGTRTDITGDGG